MRKFTLIILFVFFFFGTASARQVAKLTIKAIDENKEPIVGARVSVSFSVPNETGIGLASIRKKGSTNTAGLFVVLEQTIGRIGFSVDKAGYYQSGAGYEFISNSHLQDRWEPWNPIVEVVLKKKHNPVAGYDNHRTSYEIPNLDSSIGFDLEKGDWVVPYGKGISNDFIFTMHVVDRSYADYDCSFSLTFPNQYDGIQEYYFNKDEQSSYKWPFQAPLDGYIQKISKKKSLVPDRGYRSNEKKDVNYLFRVRSKVDKEGNIIAAKYGKLVGEFGYGPDGKITFRYILNPDGTRNLEHDPDRNLFKKERKSVRRRRLRK